MSTIPMSAIVNVIPSVISAGGTALDVIAMMLTNSTRVPVGTVAQFASAADVASYFGSESNEYALALVYFAGFDNSSVKPALVKFTQYPTAAVPAWLRGGNPGLTLTELKALAAGTITIPIDGVNITAASVDLSTATSFSNAATIIQAAFAARTPDATATSNTISGTTLTLGGTITGDWAPGQMVTGTNVTAGTYIVSLISGTPNTDGATYLLSASSTVGSGEAMNGVVVPLVAFDSLSGGFTFTTVNSGASETIDYAAASTLSTALHLTQTTGAQTSQGAAATASPASFMNALIALDTNWASFMTTFDPDQEGENSVKLAFATWNGTQNNRWWYVAWDVDLSPSTQNPATSSLGYLIKQAGISGTTCIGGDGTNPTTASYAAFAGGWAASLNFGERNGRATLAEKRQSGLVANCSNQTAMDNLIANGYNFYGAYATAAQEFLWFYPGSVSGDFLWADSYVDEIWLTNALQLAGAVLLDNTKSIPYNAFGYSLIEAAFQDPINQALNFGAIRSGVTLSASQVAEVNGDAGLPVAPIIQSQGYYLQVLDADPQTRQARQSPPCKLWYTDGQSVQQITLNSIELT